MFKFFSSTIVLLMGLSLSGIIAVNAETRVTYKSAKSTSSYYQMAVQIAENMKKRFRWGYHRDC